MDIKDFIVGMDAAIAIPLYIQIALVSGYIGYLIARNGLSHKDKPINVILISLSFSLASVLLQYIVYLMTGLSTIGCIILIGVFPLLLGVFWRKYLHKKILYILWWLRVGNSTEYPNTWIEITQNGGVTVRQATVYLKDGSALTCDDIQTFKDAPLELMRSDRDGNIALYVTRERTSPSEAFTEVQDPTTYTTPDGAVTYFRLTYVPVSEIQRVEFVTKKP